MTSWRRYARAGWPAPASTSAPPGAAAGRRPAVGDAAGVLLTPHVAIYGTPYRERWLEMLIENCRRFDAGLPLLNVVDKLSWF